MTVRVRFAPSPTGALNVGGARTALFNYLFARSRGGVFVLRIEDTDAERSTEASLHVILDGLRWLGLRWNEGPEAGGAHGPYFQSLRGDLYRDAAQRLFDAERLYPCWCRGGAAEPAGEEAEEDAAPEPGMEAARADCRCRDLSPAERARLAAEGPPALRFAIGPDRALAWDDAVHGRIEIQSRTLKDFVAMRSDGLPTYNFACVVDDHAMEISHVVRGDDHIANTPKQLLLYDALGWAPPVFGHVPLILDPEGGKLSKRFGATAVGAYADLGYIPEGMVNFLALLGWAYDGERELFTLAELEEVFRLERVGTTPAIFNLEKLGWMNGQHLRRLRDEERARRVFAWLERRGYDVSRFPEAWRVAFVRTLGDRLKTLADAVTCGRFALEPALEIEPAAWAQVREKPEVGPRLERLAERLAALPAFDLAALEQATRGLAAELGIKAGELMMPARVALTGSTTAPGLFEVMALLGRERTLSRLREGAARWMAESGARRG